MAERRAIAGVIFASIACVGSTWGLLAADSGCQLRNCQNDGGPFETLSAGVPGFQPTIENGVWQSGPVSGAWIDLPGQIGYAIKPTFDDGSPFPGPYVPYALISASPNPYSSGNFAPSAGNITQFNGNGNQINIFNDTCSEYWVWIQLTSDAPNAGNPPPPLDASPDGPNSSDASPQRDASSEDASTPDATGD